MIRGGLVFPLWPAATAVSSMGYCVSVPNRLEIRYRDFRGKVVFDAEPMVGRPYGVYVLVGKVKGSESAREASALARMVHAFSRCGWRIEIVYA